MVTRELTVVVTSFNRERYLGASIESVLESLFEDFELLVIDDASTDGSVAIAERYARLDERVRVVVNETNLGDYPNRNRALGLVSTPFLKYHDSDDLMYPHCLETMVACLHSAPEAGFALTSGRPWRGGPCPMVLTPKMAYRREYLGGGLFHCGPSGALFRTDVLRRLGGFPERGVASDFYFWISACAASSVVLAPGDLTWYRVHPGQELNREGAARAYAAASGAAWKALSSDACPLAGDELVSAKRACTHRLLRLSLRDVRHGRWSFVRARFASAGIRVRDLLRYPPQRLDDPRLGSPLDEDGDYVVPELLSGKTREEPTFPTT